MSALPAGVSPLYVAAIVIALAVIAAAAALWRRRAQPWNRWDLELYNAAKRDDIDNVVRALKHGADPNVRGPDGYTPLHIAAHENYPELVKVVAEGRRSLSPLALVPPPQLRAREGPPCGVKMLTPVAG